MTAKTKMAFALLGVAIAASACGSSASAAAKVPSINSQKAGPCNDLDLTVPKTTPPTPTANSCWADGMYVGNGSLKSKQIIFASKEADLMQYEATSAMFTTPTKWAAWEQQAKTYMSSRAISSEGADLAALLYKHEVFALPNGSPVSSSGFEATDPAECQSSVVINKNKPTPQYLVGETDIVQKSVTNGKLSTNTYSWTDVMSKVGQNYILVAKLKGSSQVPPCAG